MGPLVQHVIPLLLLPPLPPPPTALLHTLYETAGYPDEARGLERYCRRSLW